MAKLSTEKMEKYREELEFLEKATWDQFKDYVYPLLEDLDDKDAGYIEYLEGLPHMMIEDLFFTFRLVYDIPGKGIIYCTMTHELLKENNVTLGALKKAAFENVCRQGVRLQYAKC